MQETHILQSLVERGLKKMKSRDTFSSAQCRISKNGKWRRASEKNVHAKENGSKKNGGRQKIKNILRSAECEIQEG